MIKTAIIKKLPSGQYRLYSKKKDSAGHRKNLGTFDSYDAAAKHEGQVHFFKGQGADDQEAHDKSTKALKSISDVAHYLEQAGYVKHADELYAAMDSFGDFDDAAVDGIPDEQLNPENQGSLSNTGPSQGTFNSMEAEKVASLANHFDKLGLYKEADVLDEILKEAMNADDDHPAELYQNPSFIRWLQKNPNIVQMLKERYGNLFLSMIDAMDAYFNPRSEKLLGQNWENDPAKFLKWYIGSNEEKADLEWDPEKEMNTDDDDVFFDNADFSEFEDLARNGSTSEFEDLIKRPYERVISELYHAKNPKYKEFEKELQYFCKIHYEAAKARNDMEADNIDALVNGNGHQELTALDNGSNFNGLSDAYFYQSYQNLDQRYKIAP